MREAWPLISGVVAIVCAIASLGNFFVTLRVQLAVANLRTEIAEDRAGDKERLAVLETRVEENRRAEENRRPFRTLKTA